jgi:hypothetical protein
VTPPGPCARACRTTPHPSHAPCCHGAATRTALAPHIRVPGGRARLSESLCQAGLLSAGQGAARAGAWAGRAGGFAKGMTRMPAGPASECGRGPRRGGPLRGRAEVPAERIRASADSAEAAPAGPRARAGPGRALAPETRRLDRSRQLPDTRTALTRRQMRSGLAGWTTRMRCRLVGSDARVGRGEWCVDGRMAPDGGWCESGETCAPQSVRADQGTATSRGLRNRSAPGCSPCRSAATTCARWLRFVLQQELSYHHASKFTISQKCL